MSKKLRIYQLTGEERPLTWEVPSRSVLAINPDNGLKQHIQYVPGADTIWRELYKGAGTLIKPEFKMGILEVPEDDKILIQFLETHPWFGVKWRVLDQVEDAKKEIALTEKIALAFEKIGSKTIDVQTLGILVFGLESLTKNPIETEALLRRQALNNPDNIINAYLDKKEFQVKKIIALSLTKETLKVNETHTAILWADNNNPVIQIGVGEDPITELTKFLLSEKGESTLQSLTIKLEKFLEVPKPPMGEEDKKLVAELHEEYKKLYGKDAGFKYGTDIEWLTKKIEEKKKES